MTSTTPPGGTSGGKERPVCVVVPGLFGCNLKNWLGMTRWANKLELVMRNLIGSLYPSGTQLPLWTKGVEESPKDNLYTDALTSTYEPWERFMEENSTTVDFRLFYWDWRHEMSLSSKNFVKFVEDLGLSRDRPVVLVTYSTGGMIAWEAVNEYPDLFKSWLNIGASFGPGAALLDMIDRGWTLSNGIQLFRKEELFSFPVMFSYLPLSAEEEGCDVLPGFVDEDTKEMHQVDFFNAEDWKRLLLGPYQTGAGRSATKDEEQHLVNCLSAAKKWRQDIFKKPCKGEASIYPDVYVFGNKELDVPMVYYHKAGVGPLYDRVHTSVKGDGTVEWDALASKSVPGGLVPKELITSTHRHVDLPNDPACHALIMRLALD